MIFLFAFVNFLAANPGFAAWLIGGLFAVIAAMIAAYWGYMRSKIEHLETTDQDLVRRVETTEKTLEAYKEHVGAGDKVLQEMSARVSKHMDEEEEKVWGHMRVVSTKISDMQVENVEAHASLTERLVRVESKIPNGQLDKMLCLIKELVEDQDRRYHEKARNITTRVRPKGHVKK